MAGITITTGLTGDNSTPLIDLVRTARNKLDKTFEDTLQDVDAPLLRLLMANAESGSGPGYEKRSRVVMTGNARFVGLYEPVAARQEDLFAVTGSDFVHMEKHIQFDQKEIDMCSGEEQIVDLMDGRMSDQWEDLAMLVEYSLAQPPASNTDAYNLRGPLYWFPAMGVSATADYIGGFNGTTVTFRDGSTTSTTIGKADRSTARNQRLRSWQVNYTGDIDDIFLDALRRARTRTAFRSLPGLKGTAPANVKPNWLFMPHAQADLCEKRANKGPDDLNNDLNRFVDPAIAGMQPIRVPAWDTLAYAPIVGVRSSKWIVRKLKDRWFKALPEKSSASQTEVVDSPMVCSALAHVADARSGGFCMSIPR